MTGTQTLVARAALGAMGALASIVLTGWRRLRELPARTFDGAVVLAFALSRFGLFVIVFLVLHVAPRGDIPGFYFPQALEVLSHHLPYRDFPSSYAPLHAYLDAVFITIDHTPLAIIVASLFGELLLFALWLGLGRRFFGESTLRSATLLYLASPISLQFVTVDGQDNVLIALLLAIALLFAVQSRAFLSGALVGLSAAVIKFLPLLFVPAFFLVLPRRLRWAAGAAVALTIVYGGSLLLHLPILQPLTAEGGMRSAGNLPYFVEAIGGFVLPARLSDGLLLTVLACILALIGRSALRAPDDARMRVLAYGMGALTLALLLFSKKSWPPYLMLCLFPLCLLVSREASERRQRVALFAVLSFAAVTEPSIWSSLLLEAPSHTFHTELLTGSHPAQLLFTVHLLLLAGYVWLLQDSIRRIRRAHSEV